MSSRSTPRLVSGARLGAHRIGKPVLVVNDGPVEPQAATRSDAPHAAAPLDETPASGPLDRLAGLRRPRPVTWLSDMLVPERNSFGVLRLMMAMAVLVSHAYFLASGDHTVEPLYRWTGYTLGQHGVQVFFFLSGILVAQSLMKSESVRDYAIARGLRIFPALIVCVLLTAIALGPWISTSPPIAYFNDKAVTAYIIKTLSLMTGSAPLPGVFEGSPGAAKGVVNSSLWTLKYEVLCYVALAAVGWIAIRTKRHREVAAVAIVGWLALVMATPVGIELGSQKSAFEIFRYFALFFGAGSIAYVLRRWLPIHGLALVPLSAVLAAAIGTRFAEPAMAVTLGYGALWLATFDFWGLRGYTNHSDYSYGTYIYGMPVSQTLLHFLPGLHVISLVLLTTGIVLLLSFLSWEAVERPALALRHRFRRFERASSAESAEAAKPRRVTAIASTTATVTQIASRTARSKTTSPPPFVPAGSSKTEVPSETNVSPGPAVARPWRPASAPIRLRVARDASEHDRDEPAPSSEMKCAPEVPEGRMSMALNRTKMVPPTAKSANDPVATATGNAHNATSVAEPRGPRPRQSWRSIRPLHSTER